MNYSVLSPLKFSGSVYGDFGYQINGVNSPKGYTSREGAKRAMERELTRRGFYA